MNLKSSLSVMTLLSMLVLSTLGHAEEVKIEAMPQSIVDSGYKLQQGDVVFASVWGEETMQMKDLRVLPDGTISFPLAGSIAVSGLTTTQVAAAMAEKLKAFLPEPQVTIIVTGIDGNRVYVIGKVSRPGPIPLVTPTTVLQALSMAGVLDRFADKDEIKLIRMTDQGQVAIPVHYDSLIKGRNLESNVVLQSGDTLVVP